MPSPEDRAEKAYPSSNKFGLVEPKEIVNGYKREGYALGWKECEREPRVVTLMMTIAAINVLSDGGTVFEALEAAEKARKENVQ